MVSLPTASALDASALIAFLQGEPGADVIADVLTDPTLIKYVHAINLCETYYHFWRQNDQPTAEDAATTIMGLNVVVREDMDPAFWREVARLKTAHTLSLGDCCGLALALRLGANFVTADHHEMDEVASQGTCPILFIR